MTITGLGLIGLPRKHPGVLDSHRGTALDEADWDDGKVLLDISTGDNFATARLPPGSWILLAKARDLYGNYSDGVSKKAITIINQNDVVDEPEQSPDWPGTLTGFYRHWPSGSLIPASRISVDDAGWRLFDEFVPDPVDTSIYVAPEKDIGFDYPGLRVWSESSIRTGYGEEEAPDPQHAIDYHLSGEEYDGFESWTIGKVEASAVKQRIMLDNTGGAGALTSFKPVVDALKRVVEFNGYAVAAGGSVIDFDPRFIASPNVKITPGSNLTGWWELKSATSVKVHLSNAAGADVGGVADITISGA